MCIHRFQTRLKVYIILGQSTLSTLQSHRSSTDLESDPVLGYIKRYLFTSISHKSLLLVICMTPAACLYKHRLVFCYPSQSLGEE